MSNLVLKASLDHGKKLRTLARAFRTTTETISEDINDFLDKATFPQGRTWAQELYRARARRGLTAHQLASRLPGAKKRDVEAWEAGSALPNSMQMKVLEASLPSLKRLHEQVIRQRNEAKQEPEKPVEPTPPAKPPEAKKPVDVAPAASRTADPAELKAFGEKLSFLRTQAQMSIADLARKLDLSPTTVSNWETAQSAPSQYYRDLLAKVCPGIEASFPSHIPLNGKGGPYQTKRRIEALAETAATPPNLYALPRPSITPPADGDLEATAAHHLACIRARNAKRNELARLKEEHEKRLTEMQAAEELAQMALEDAERAMQAAHVALQEAAKQ